MRASSSPLWGPAIAIVITLAASSARGNEPSPAVPAIAYATSGAALIVGTMAGLWTLEKSADLETRCPEACTRHEVENAIDIANASTAGFAIAGIAATIGTVTLLLHLYAADEDDATEMDLRAGADGVDLEIRF